MLVRNTGSGTLADNIVGFGRALRRAGLPIDASRIAMAQSAMEIVGLTREEDVSAALEAVMVSREQDRMVFRELFCAYFRHWQVVDKQQEGAPTAGPGKTRTSGHGLRVHEALCPQTQPGAAASQPGHEVELDAAMTASDRDVLKHGDFNSLSAAEYLMVERIAREIPLPIPKVQVRRTRPGRRGARLHWAHCVRRAVVTGGELMDLRFLQRRRETLPLLVLVDVSGSMERYARLLLSFLHAATRGRRREVFAFGTRLTDLSPGFRLRDADKMLAAASASIHDFAGGTRLGDSLATLRMEHGQRLVGRRTLVLVVSDGLDTGNPEALGSELDWLRRHSRRVLWLNPLLRFEGYQPLAFGAVELRRNSDAMLAVHNLASLHDLASSIAAVVTR